MSIQVNDSDLLLRESLKQSTNIWIALIIGAAYWKKYNIVARLQNLFMFFVKFDMSILKL